MQTVKTESFDFEDQTYETIVVNTGKEYKVRVYVNNHPANPYVYTDDFTNSFDYSQTHAEAAYERLMVIARKEIENKVWRPQL